MTSRLRRNITKKFKRLGLSLQKDAMSKMIELYQEQHADVDEIVASISKLTIQHKLSSCIVSVDILQSAIDKYTKAEEPMLDVLQIQDAFETPRFRYKRVRKEFTSVPNGSVHGNANDLNNLFRERYEILLQRTLRDQRYTKSSFRNNDNARELTTTTELFGCRDVNYVLGMLSELEEGKTFLQDINGHIQIDVTESCNQPGLFTWGSFVIAKGRMSYENVFEVEEMQFPPMEPRGSVLKHYSNLDFVPFDRREQLKREEKTREDDLMVFLSNVYLDQNQTMDLLHQVFVGYSSPDIVPPKLFVFMGNFSKQRLGCNPKDMKVLKSLFEKLCDLIVTYPRLVHESDFVLVPGPHDPSIGNVLPKPGLLPSLTQKLSSKLHCAFPSNPFRIHFGTQEIVVFRDDLLQKMRRKCIAVPFMKEKKSIEITHQLAKTVLDQSHLCPLPLPNRPISWNYDHALRLYPPPDVLILADSHEEYTWEYKGTRIVCPGEFSLQGRFVDYTPAHIQDEDALRFNQVFHNIKN